MGLQDRSTLIDALGETTYEVLERSLRQGITPLDVAEKLVRERIEAAG